MAGLFKYDSPYPGVRKHALERFSQRKSTLLWREFWRRSEIQQKVKKMQVYAFHAGAKSKDRQVHKSCLVFNQVL